MLGRVLALILKELWAVWADKKSRLILIIPPLFQLFIFSFAATLDVVNIPIGVLNLDAGERSIELLQRFKEAHAFGKITYLETPDQITPFINNQVGVMVIYIDELFSRNLDASQPANVQIILDGRKSNTSQILVGYASQIAAQFSQDYAARVAIQPPTSTIVPRYWFNPNLIYVWYNVPCIVAILTTMLALLITSLSVSREREMGTFDQLLVSPIRPFEILLGKSIPAVIVSMAGATLILLAGIIFFRIPFKGSLELLYLSLLVYVCSIVGIGLFISSICNTQQQSILGTYLFMSPAVTLSGFATPIDNMPVWLQNLTYFNPMRYIFIIVREIFLKAMPLEIVLQNLWPMALIAFFTLAAANYLFRHRLE